MDILTTFDDDLDFLKLVTDIGNISMTLELMPNHLNGSVQKFGHKVVRSTKDTTKKQNRNHALTTTFARFAPR